VNVSNDNPPPVKPRRQRRWLVRLGVGLLVFLAVVAGRRLYRHYQVSRALEEAVVELDHSDPGWRLEEIEAAREKVPDEENSALRIVAAGKLLPGAWPAHEFSDMFKDLPPQEQLTPDMAARLQAELENHKDAVGIARQLVDLPRGRHHIEYLPNLLETRLDDQGTSRKVAWLLFYDVMRCAQAGDPRQALSSCRAIVNAGRSLGDEPTAISQLIRIACVVSACQAAERILAQGEPPPVEMQRLQAALAEEELFPGQLIALRGDRAFFHGMFDVMEQGEVLPSELADSRPPWEERWFGWIIRDNFRAEHPLMLSLMARRIRLAQLPLHEQAAAERTFEAEVLARRSSETILTGLFVPGTTKIGQASRRKHARIRCATAALACERYRQKAGTWPAKLADLVSDYLPEVPTDPYDGKPLRFRRLADGLAIYTLGPDEQDDGGTFDREKPIRPGTDIGFRLWDAVKRRQPPSPRPAKPAGPPALPE
jgi:hypothetical protein